MSEKETRRKELKAKLEAWHKRQSELWHALMDSLSPDQREIYHQYNRTSNYIQCIQRHLNRLDRPAANPWAQAPKEVPWPDEDNE
jgi:hypothetical protein